MKDFTITSFRVEPLDIPMKKAFGIAGGAQAQANNVLVELTLGSGIHGYGEAAPFPAFNGETQHAALAACMASCRDLVGCDIRNFRPLAERIGAHAVHDGSPVASAACAVETALFDALSRGFGTSLRTFFGGSTDELFTDVTITTGTVQEAEREALTFKAFSTLKVKVGGTDVDHDVRRVLAIASARPDARLLLDANGGFSMHDAVKLALELARHHVIPALFEQPVSPSSCGGTREAFEALREIRDVTKLPVALDEMLARPEDVVVARDHGAADAVNIKLMKSGIMRAIDLVSTARASGMLPMIGGMVEARLAMGASACLAAGLGGFAFVDLDTPLFLAQEPFDGGYVQTGERLDVSSITLGHGCTPRHSRTSEA